MRTAFGLFLVAHALVTGAIWLTPPDAAKPAGFGNQASWLFADSRPAMVTVTALAAGALAIAGVGVLANASWWAAPAAVGAVASLALVVATFTPWWTAAIAINVALLYYAAQPAAFLPGR